MSDRIDPLYFRQVLGNFPTGVAAVTSCDESGGPVGMIVGSFTSVSLEPPLVAFLPAKQSSTAPRILQNGRFCVNVLGARQEPVSRSFATGGERKFEDVDWRMSATGLPKLDSSVAWIECTVESVHEAGDHDIVVGRVTSLEAAESTLPLLFFQGGYGRFAPMSFAAAGEPDLAEHLRLVDLARPFMEAVVAGTSIECQASAAVGGEIVLLATAGTPADGRRFSRVGQRLPHLPPLGTVLVAWSDSATAAWFDRAGDLLTASRRAQLEALLDRVRERGWAVATWSDNLRSLEAVVDRATLEGPSPQAKREIQQMVHQLGSEHDPEDVLDPGRGYRLRNLTVPVFNTRKQVAMQLTMYGLPTDAGPAELDDYLALVQGAATGVSQAMARAHL